LQHSRARELEFQNINKEAIIDKMLFGTVMPEHGTMSKPEPITVLATRAEQLGFSALEFGDHIIIPEKIESKYPYSSTGEPPNWEEWVEQITALSFLAGKTSKIKLVTSIMVLPYRNPLVAAKMLASLDYLSNGRLIVGVGSGWLEEEFRALDVGSFFGERGPVSEEIIQIFKEVWSKMSASFQGEHFSFPQVKFFPKPVQKPFPPIWVGGESAPAMKRAARLGDAWYPIGSNPHHPLRTIEQLGHAIRRLREYARTAGRKPSEVQISYVSPQFMEKSSDEDELFVGTYDKIAMDIRACEELGVSYISFDFLDQAQDLGRSVSNMEEFAREIMNR
jgi:probable F420-dependent oxidoreductase